MKQLIKKLKRALRRRQSSIVYVQCPSCLDLVDAYVKHNCMVIEAQEVTCER